MAPSEATSQGKQEKQLTFIENWTHVLSSTWYETQSMNSPSVATQGYWGIQPSPAKYRSLSLLPSRPHRSLVNWKRDSISVTLGCRGLSSDQYCNRRNLTSAYGHEANGPPQRAEALLSAASS
ncbi:rCG29849 [Rattus norvegicus]|uniref:RCG29849 n=1 Tax=Rattus norvegicus TaxID=10116 RepID=A6IN15_RAT|nr:rCG29849 [Rattus norvegicus]